MSDTQNIVERHGCIVDGTIYDVLVVYSPSGAFLDCTVMNSTDAHCIKGYDRPLVACNRHSPAEVDAAIATHFPGHESDEDREARP